MEKLSAATAEAFLLLRKDLYEYLDGGEALALKYDEWCDEDVKQARALIPDLVTVIRGILVLHEETSSGTCAGCGGPSWPCTTVQTIHRLIKDPENCFTTLLNYARMAIV